VRMMERRVARAAAVVLGASSDLVDQARSRGARDARLAPVAVPAARCAPAEGGAARQKARAEVGAVERPLLVAVGGLRTDRGFGLLLDAARAWRWLDPQPLLVIAGEGPGRAELQRRIEAEGLPVRLLGCRDDVPELLAAADVAVLSSRWEARSLLAQEALHAGVPLVATAVGGVPELVGEAAELVPYGEPEALADAVQRLLEDPLRRAELAAAGRAQTAGWPTEDDTVAHVLSIYDELAQT
jgi:glycosyltransferase involved in cell wall biosynthesis